jgi:hypothetical protein
MPASVWHPDVQGTLESARQRTTRHITLDGQTIEISPPFPSPQDWRDQWIYFLMLDRFNNPTAPPRQLPYDSIYGRQYFRPLSGDHTVFRVSTLAPGVLAFSRLLSDQEVVIVANTDTQDTFSLAIIVDGTINSVGAAYQVLYSNKSNFTNPGPVAESSAEIVVYEVNGEVGQGPVKFITVTLQPMEVQILRN